MAGYVRQSAADIVPTAVVRAAPINNELNALRDAFAQATGHKHDGTAAEGHYIPVIGDADAKNKVAVDTVNNRVGVFTEVSTVSTEQVRFQDGAIVPVTDNDIDLGTGSLEFKDLYIDGTANIDSLIADTAAISAGTINNTVVGNTTPNVITGTTITATVGFVGGLTGAVTGNTAGTHTGAVVGNVTGDLTGNVAASSGSSSFNDVVINGSLNMNAGTSATIINLTTPTNAGDAATKGYVDTADALKVNKSGDTMSGVLAMGNNKITGLATPTNTADASTKGYVDTSIAALLDSAPGALDTLNELAAALGDDPNFATTVTNEIATKVSKAGDTMTGALAMGGNKVTGLGAPTSDNDAATKTYVDTADALKLSLTGGTMSGAIAMGTNKLTGVGDPTANQDAATKKYVDDQDALKLSLTGGTMSGAVAMGNNKITGLATPTDNADAATKLYVDGILGSATSAAASAAAAAISESNAAGSASAASTSESNALSSANAAAASYDSFDDRYLGAKTSDPTLDNDGNALLTGALYFNSTAGEMRVWSGSAWVATYLPATGYATLNGAETLTNKTISVDSNTLSGITASSFVLSNVSGNIDGTAAQKAIPSGVVVGTTDTQTLTNKTIDGSNNTITNVSLTAGVTGTLPVANGGTGATSLTANNVLLGNGTSAVQVVAPGTSGNVLTSNGTTWTSTAAVAASTLTAIASGSLSDGSTVIVNADGTVSVAGTIAQSVGTPAVFESANTSLICATYDSTNQRVVIAYRDNGNSAYGTAIVGTVSDTSISFGTAVVFVSTGIVATSITYDSTNQKVVIAYADGSNSKAIVGTVSGTSISFGTAVVFDTAATDAISTTYDSTNQKVVIAYRDLDNSFFGTAIVGTVSGTSISFGTAVVFESANTTVISAAYDSTNQKVIIAYRDVGNSNYGTAIVGTVSGTSISFGTAVVFESASTSAISAAYDSTNQKVVIAYSDGGNSSYGTAIVGTVSGTSISFGTAVVFESANTGPISAVYDSSVRKVVIAYRDVGNSGYGTIIVGTVSGTSISFGTAVVFESADTSQLFATYDFTNQKVVIAYRDEGNSTFGTAVVFRNQSTNLTTENFIGFSNAAYTNGETATIQIVGAVDDAQSGLTPGQSYFVQTDGTLGLAPSNPSVFAGTAVASNKIIVKG